MTLVNPLWLIGVLLLLPIIIFAPRRRSKLGHSQVAMHANIRCVPLWGWLPTVFLALFWCAICIALARPQFFEKTSTTVVQLRDFVVSVDVSGSMAQALEGEMSVDGSPVNRNTAARSAVKSFVDNRRSGDRVAIMLFDSSVYPLWPLTVDLSLISKKLSMIDGYSGGSTNFDGPIRADGEGVGGIQGAIDHIKELSRVESKVVIFVTDGEDDIDETRFQELLVQMRQLNIRIYVLAIGWRADSHPDLEKFVDALGGNVIRVEGEAEMKSGFAEIDRLETSPGEIEISGNYVDLYPVFLWICLASLLLYFVSITVVRDDL